MTRGRVWVEMVDGEIVRIFRSGFYAARSTAWDEGRVKEYPRRDAVASIRLQVFKRSENRCAHCGLLITWGTMHLHEKLFRSEGGEISIENSIALCYMCHQGREDSAHGNRRLQWTQG